MAVKKTAAEQPAETTVNAEPAQSKPGVSIYVGPSILGYIQKNTIYPCAAAEAVERDDVKIATEKYPGVADFIINVDELQVSSLSVGQTVQVTADAVQDRTYEGVVTRVSMKGDTSGGTTTYPVTVRIDETDGLRPGMNANAEIVVAQAKNALAVPNAAVVRGSYVLVTQDSPSAVNADPDMVAPDGFVYVKVKLGVSDSDYTQVVSGLTAQDTVGYDPSSVSSDTYYDNGGYEYTTDGTTDTTGGETTDGKADGEGAESTVTEEPAVDEPVDAGNDGEVIGEADGVILT